MSLTLRAPSSPLDWLRIRILYQRAFPRYERKPFKIIRRMQREGRTDVWLAERDGRFAGLAATINGGKTILLDYFAVERRLRGQGVGSAFLQALLDKYAGLGLFVEIEAADRDDPTGEKRRRKAFYLRNGLSDMHVVAILFGVRMELLGRGCTLDFDGYRAFYHDHYSAWAAEHVVRPID